VDPSVGPENAKASADSREVFFFMAVDIWKEHPVFGIGPACFSIASGTGLQAHTLYAETLSELGSVGVFAVCMLVLCYVLNYFEARRIYRAIPPPNEGAFCYRVVLATFVTLIQLLFFGLGGHNLFRFTWLWYGAFAALAIRFLRAQYNERIRQLADQPAPTVDVESSVFPSPLAGEVLGVRGVAADSPLVPAASS
jgi:hypothetical protein